MENEWQNPDLDWCSEQICSAQTHSVAENVEGELTEPCLILFCMVKFEAYNLVLLRS